MKIKVNKITATQQRLQFHYNQQNSIFLSKVEYTNIFTTEIKHKSLNDRFSQNLKHIILNKTRYNNIIILVL